jgi:hypothetical protein
MTHTYTKISVLLITTFLVQFKVSKVFFKKNKCYNTKNKFVPKIGQNIYDLLNNFGVFCLLLQRDFYSTNG